MIQIVQFFPDRLDVNGDAQNALVLAQRARWAGFEAEVISVTAGGPLPRDRPAAVVIGSSVDAELPGLSKDFADFADALTDWATSGVPLLAVGTGLELLCDVIELDNGFIDGLGILSGSARPLPARSIGDLVVDAREGRLVGFENHARGLVLPAEARPLGAVVRGTGNGTNVEGARQGSVIGTHLHGPVLAKNPILADAMLVVACGDSYRADSPGAQQVDRYASAARASIFSRLQLPSTF